MTKDWQDYFFKLAELTASKSKDPSSKVGCVIVDKDQRVISLAFNGFPVGVKDDSRLADRDLKNRIIIHSEMNAIIFAKRCIKGCSMFIWPYPPCERCAPCIIQAGITEIYSPNNKPERWLESFNIAEELFQEAKVKLVYR